MSVKKVLHPSCLIAMLEVELHCVNTTDDFVLSFVIKNNCCVVVIVSDVKRKSLKFKIALKHS